MNITKLLLGSAISIVSMLGCDSPKSPGILGTAGNPGRAKRSIPSLPDNWPQYAYFPGRSIQWSNPVGWGPPPKGHLMKEIELSANGQPIAETDIYYTGRGYKYLDVDMSTPEYEKVSFTYTYGNEQSGTEPWICVIEAGPHAGKHSLIEGEQILKQLGISRRDN